MDIYKKKGLNFTKGIDGRQLRAHKRSEERRNSKHLRLSSVRNIDPESFENSVCEGDTTFHPEKSEFDDGFRKPQAPSLKVPSRLEALKKWKTEKELKRKFEAIKKAKPFVVSSQVFKPVVGVGETVTNKVNSKTHFNVSLKGPSVFAKSKTMQVSQPPGITKKLPMQRSAIQQPVAKTAMPQIAKPVSQTKSLLPAKTGVQATVSRFIKPVFQPKNPVPVSKTATRNAKFPVLSRETRPKVSNIPPPMAKETRKFPGVTKLMPPTTTQNRSFGFKPKAPAPKLASSAAVRAKVTQPAKLPKQVPDSGDQKRESFAPHNFKFQPPLGLFNMLFPNGIKSQKSFTPTKKFDFFSGKTPGKKSSREVPGEIKTSKDESVKSADKDEGKSNVGASFQDPKVLPVPCIDFAAKKKDRMSGKSNDLKASVPKQAADVLSDGVRETKKGRNSARKSLFHGLEEGKLGAIAEEESQHSILTTPVQILTPRRSMRLKSLAQKEEQPELKGGLYGTPKSQVVEKFAELNISSPKTKMDSIDEQENHPTDRKVTLRKRSTQQDNFLSPLKSISLNSPGKPLTRQQHKISLLGSPYKPDLCRRSINGDLISFSPV